MKTLEAERPAALTNPWLFVPLLYLMQSVPVTVVQEVASVFYKDLGIANEPIVRWTSLISLPWSLQLLLGPLVDLTSTKRNWILGGQFLIAIGLSLTAFLLRIPHTFELTILILGVTAVTSALCNIATDGFYILSMPRDRQAKFVGVQTTCYRLGRLCCIGLLPLFVGKLQKAGFESASAWSTVLLIATAIYFFGYLANRLTVPRPEEDVPAAPSEENERELNLDRTLVLVAFGVSAYFFANAVVRLTANALAGMLGPSFAGWRLPENDFVVGFNSHVSAVATELGQSVVCGLVATACWVLARRRIVGTPMGDAFATFFRQPGIVPIFFFILFYRFGEAMVSKMSPLFLKDAIEKGGLAIPNDQLGLIKGVAGVIGIICGGLAGGYVVGKLGLRKSFFPLALAMHLPNLLYLWASTHTMPMAYVSLPLLGPLNVSLAGVDFVDQFGYGFGFAAYMVYIMRVAQRGRYKTSHYAIGTGMGALCIAVAGIVSGVVQSNFGYHGLFIAVIFLSLPGLLTLLFIPIDES